MTNIFGLIEVLIVFFAVIIFALWELWALRRDKRRLEAAKADAKTASDQC